MSEQGDCNKILLLCFFFLFLNGQWLNCQIKLLEIYSLIGNQFFFYFVIFHYYTFKN